VIFKEKARALEEINMMTNEEPENLIAKSPMGQRIIEKGIAGQTHTIQELQERIRVLEAR